MTDTIVVLALVKHCWSNEMRNASSNQKIIQIHCIFNDRRRVALGSISWKMRDGKKIKIEQCGFSRHRRVRGGGGFYKPDNSHTTHTYSHTWTHIHIIVCVKLDLAFLKALQYYLNFIFLVEFLWYNYI